MDHLDFIKLLIDHGANVNMRVCGMASTATQCRGDSTETRTIFTMQWLYEDGATPFLRAAQSGDVDADEAAAGAWRRSARSRPRTM